MAKRLAAAKLIGVAAHCCRGSAKMFSDFVDTNVLLGFGRFAHVRITSRGMSEWMMDGCLFIYQSPTIPVKCFFESDIFGQDG